MILKYAKESHLIYSKQITNSGLLLLSAYLLDRHTDTQAFPPHIMLTQLFGLCLNITFPCTPKQGRSPYYVCSLYSCIFPDNTSDNSKEIVILFTISAQENYKAFKGQEHH